MISLKIFSFLMLHFLKMLSIYKSVIETKFTYYTFWHIIICIISAAHIFIHFIYSFIKAEVDIIPTYSIEQKQQKRKTITFITQVLVAW